MGLSFDGSITFGSGGDTRRALLHDDGAGDTFSYRRVSGLGRREARWGDSGPLGPSGGAAIGAHGVAAEDLQA
jgi:hypothetical protein